MVAARPTGLLLSTCAADAGAAADCSSLAAVVLQAVREGMQQVGCCMTAAWPVLFCEMVVSADMVRHKKACSHAGRV
jgi:hypothetical protein